MGRFLRLYQSNAHLFLLFFLLSFAGGLPRFLTQQRFALKGLKESY